MLDLDLDRQPVPLADWGDLHRDARGDATLGQVRALPADAWQPTQPGRHHGGADEPVVWVRFSIPPAPDHERWYLRLPQPGLAHVTLYTRSPAGWTPLVAGARVPVALWPVPGPVVVLPVDVSAEDVRQHLLRIQAVGGWRESVACVSQSRLAADQQRPSLAYGMYVGLLAMLVLLAVAAAALLRDWACLWFGLWAALLALSSAAAAGLAALHLWPGAQHWGEAAPTVLPLAGFVPLLLFVAQAASLKARSAALHRSTLALAALLLLLRNQERRDCRRRILRLDQADPTTGLINDEVFEQRVRGAITRAQRFGHQAAVILIECTNMHALRQEFGRRATLEVLLRTAGRRTSMMQEMDTVARVGEWRFGVLVERPVPPEKAAALGSKLLARLILPFSRLPMGLVVRPTVVVAVVPQQGADAQGVLAMLDAMIKQAPADQRRNVYVAESLPAGSDSSLPSSLPPSVLPRQP